MITTKEIFEIIFVSDNFGYLDIWKGGQHPEMNESLREAACLGNLLSLQKLLRNGANVNSRNRMNGWTALHWACKRGHKVIVCQLLEEGADVNLKTLKGETPAALTESPEILTLLGSPTEDTPPRETASPLPIVPHYLEHPPFPYTDLTVPDSTTCRMSQMHTHTLKGISNESEMEEIQPTDGGVIVKVRVCDSGESDFVEVEVPALTYSALLRACCEELNLSSTEVAKIRKLPNVLVRKDKDVQRIKAGQELEIVAQLEANT